MVESAEESGATSSLPCVLIITHILTASMIDISTYKPLEVSSTYDTQAFASMGYVLHDDKWSKMGLVKVKVEQQKGSKISADSASELLTEVGEIKGRFAALEDGMQQLQRPRTRTSKDTSTNVGKLRISMDDIQCEGIKTANKLIQRVNAIMQEAESSRTELAIVVRTYYSNLSKNVEKSYN